MSDPVKHECGIALIRLLKPIEYYIGKYGTAMYGINKLYLLMEKQHNRGQDGAGAACIKLDVEPGYQYIDRYRSNSESPIKDIFEKIGKPLKKIHKKHPELINDVNWLKHNFPFIGELLLGHLRYGTYGGNNIEFCHPLLRSNNWKTRNLVIAGNFNLTNVKELFDRLLSIGQHPVETSDTITILEKIGHFLDKEIENLYRKYKAEGISKADATPLIAKNIDVKNIVYNSCKYWDGGFVVAGLIGNGDAFVVRDSNGIRPAYYYQDDEVIAVASERPVLQTTFNVLHKSIKEVTPGNILIIKENGHVEETQCLEPKEKRSCSFERIYFSRGTDYEIYNERKQLGRNLCKDILTEINYDLRNAIFSYIPNTAIDAFYGLKEALTEFSNDSIKEKIMALGKNVSKEQLDEIFSIQPRFEKIAVKDVKLRTFITKDKDRDDLASHVYDVTYGCVKDNIDTLVVLDDSIVRGTTLKQSILTMLDRLLPKTIIVVSSAPQIRYPDCYGIDMAKINDFIAFKATIELLKDKNMGHIINEVYRKSKAQENLPKEEIVNYVKEIYAPFSAKQISEKIAEMLKPEVCQANVKIIYQSIENLHSATPQHKGDWYFTGNYPTPGGNMIVNKAFINFIEDRNIRAY
ncbi:MAG: amidophosphoribosyltransferase [Bacteroidetes bacterium GWF2_29_10]|nr:MAG: amidophosphoribosyltransferase [Bacteroidetes bacterium GWF2_29_10]